MHCCNCLVMQSLRAPDDADLDSLLDIAMAIDEAGTTMGRCSDTVG